MGVLPFAFACGEQRFTTAQGSPCSVGGSQIKGSELRAQGLQRGASRGAQRRTHAQLGVVAAGLNLMC